MSEGKKIILHLCADIGSDSRYYQLDDNYEVIKIGIENGITPQGARKFRNSTRIDGVTFIVGL